ncbi:hypothetical protein CWC38_11575 [Kocuria tytonicola]|uniref:Uncharacterized protein n=1 Tax=Kocuria tytonicola TaxID=2055946 RepID=A0A3L9LUC8_9MICC|nr:hypothetical protein EAE32_05625 [Kocuria tytonicola]RLZ02359.1 hypothetical protein CWC38_11575 [Kocuria tytonicola]
MAEGMDRHRQGRPPGRPRWSGRGAECEILADDVPANHCRRYIMSKRGRKRKDRRKNSANRGKRPNS